MPRHLMLILLAGGACGDAAVDEGDAAPAGPPYSGTIIAGGMPQPDTTIELLWRGGVVEVTTDDEGAFSTTLPEAGASYQVIVPPGDGHWGHSSWLLDVPETGSTGIRYTLGTDGVFEGFSNVLGEPRLSEDSGLVSVEIRINEAQAGGKGFNLAADADPIFVFNSDGMPFRSDVLIDGGDITLVFGNVAPRLLSPATPHEGTPCTQLAPASELRAKTVLILVAGCE